MIMWFSRRRRTTTRYTRTRKTEEKNRGERPAAKQRCVVRVGMRQEMFLRQRGKARIPKFRIVPLKFTIPQVLHVHVCIAGLNPTRFPLFRRRICWLAAVNLMCSECLIDVCMCTHVTAWASSNRWCVA